MSNSATAQQNGSIEEVEGEGFAARPIRLVIVDDHEVVRAGLTAVFAREQEVQVVAALDSGEAVVARIDALKPDVVLLDYRLPGMSGSAACVEITRRSPKVAVVILTTYVDDDIIHSCLVAGARGYVLKDSSTKDLIHAVIAVARGESVLAPQVTQKVVSWARQSRALVEGHETLSTVESTVLAMVAEGMSNPAIAGRLNVSAQSVKLTLRAIMSKLGVNKRSEAVAVGIRRGLI